jgi:DNA-binding CsgD family transcriptional regulator
MGFAATGGSAVRRARRRSEVLARREQGIPLRQIAEELNCSHETVRRDVLAYLIKTDQENRDKVAAIRAREFERLDQYSELLHKQITNDGEYNRIDSAVKVSESARKIYAADIPAERRATITHRREIVTQLLVELRTKLSPIVFAEVTNALSESVPGNQAALEGGCSSRAEANTWDDGRQWDPTGIGTSSSRAVLEAQTYEASDLVDPGN